MSTKSLACVLSAFALLTSFASAQVSLRPLGTVDLDSTANSSNPQYVGSNPSAVAWDGADLYVAGFNSSGGTANVGITKITTPLTTPSFSVAFGQIATPNLRGYSGLDITGGTLAAAYDNGGTDPNGITAWDASTTTMLWAKAARGGSGVGFDPGFGGVDSGVGWATFGSGRRPLQDTVTGADIYTTSNGMVIFTSQGTFWRDVEFDDVTGDIWLREGNNVIHGVRTGGNSASPLNVPFDPMDADFVAVQNLAFVRADGVPAVFFNDRSTTASGQAFADVVKVIAPDGTDLVVDWGGFTAPNGVGAYDFSYDASSQTLAILDFANRDVYMFAVSGNCSALASTGNGQPGTTLQFDLTGAAANAPAILSLGTNRGNLTFNIGSAGTLSLGLDVFIPLQMGLTDGNGDASLSQVIPAGTRLATLYAQGFSIQVMGRTNPTLDFCTSNVRVFSIGQ